MRRRAAIHLGLFLLFTSGFVCAGSQRTYQLIGSVRQSDGKPFRGVTPVVFLQNALTPFTTHTFADSGGEFKFMDLLPGMYSLIITIPRVGEQYKTIEIGPSFADSKGRVNIKVTFERKPQTLDKTVSTVELGLSDEAKMEYRKAHTCLERSDAAGAIAHLKKALELAPKFPTALNILGTLAYQSRNFAEAERYFRQALEQEPDSYAPLVNLGGALLSEGKWQESLSYNLLAVQARPDDALGQAQLGQSYFAVGQLDAAEVALKNAKALDPGHFSYPQLVLARIYLQKQNPERVILEMEEFLKLHPDSDRASAIRKALQELRGKKP
jgi:Tfp pilus assembly protein PilF